MIFFLYDVMIFLNFQIFCVIDVLFDKVEVFVVEWGIEFVVLIDVRFVDDMLLFGYQVKFCVLYLVGGIEGVCGGIFVFDCLFWLIDFVGFYIILCDVIVIFEVIDWDVLDMFVDSDIWFEFGVMVMLFIGVNFLLFFLQFNFYFYVIIVYVILCNQGLVIGKCDFMGMLCMKG